MKSSKSIEFGKLVLEAVTEDKKPSILSISIKEGDTRRKTVKITFEEAKNVVDWLQREVFNQMTSDPLSKRKAATKAPVGPTTGRTSMETRLARQKLEGISDLGGKNLKKAKF